MNLEITLNTRRGEPIYEQIESQMEAAILEGRLQEGEALPGIRTLAKMLKVSVITVQKAYENLNRKGLIVSATGRGTMVAPLNQEQIRQEKMQELDALLQKSAAVARQMHLSPEKTAERLMQFMERAKNRNEGEQ